MKRCSWATKEPIKTYHDKEHGIMPKTNKKLFELLVLEIFQPGLSFNIVLTKREGLKEYFNNYDVKLISSMTDKDINKGLENTNIIRHKLKITSVISNAKLIHTNNINLKKYILENIDYSQGLDKTGTLLSKQMKKDGFKFVGPSVVTSLLEAIGLLEGHEPGCSFRK